MKHECFRPRRGFFPPLVMILFHHCVGYCTSAIIHSCILHFQIIHLEVKVGTVFGGCKSSLYCGRISTVLRDTIVYQPLEWVPRLLHRPLHIMIVNIKSSYGAFDLEWFSLILDYWTWLGESNLRKSTWGTEKWSSSDGIKLLYKKKAIIIKDQDYFSDLYR